MNDRVIPLAASFEPASREAWLALVEKTLKGAGADSLVQPSADGIAIAPLYPPAFGPALPSWRATIGEQAWDIRTVTWHPDPSRANADILEDLAGGASSVLVASWDPADLPGVLSGVMTDVAPVALDAGFLGPRAAEALADIAKSAPGAPLAFHMDPISAFAREGSSPGPIGDHIAAAAATAARHAETYPKASLMLASGHTAHEAGGTEGQELAMMAAAAVAYARALTEAGLSVERALGGMVLRVAADQDYFVSIAKLRAARRLWARITQACGAPQGARIEARASGRMLTAADPWINLVRLTAAGFAAAVGGADAIVLGAFTDVLGLPSALARRQARNTQLILMEEAHLGRVADPAAGSGYIESLTEALAREAWARFQAIEKGGGLVAELVSGGLQRDVGAARAALEADLREGRRTLLGVTGFKAQGAAAVEFEPVANLPQVSARLPGDDTTCAPLVSWRFEEAVG